MDYDFTNGPNAIESIQRFKGYVSECIIYLDKDLEEIITKIGEKPKSRFVDKIEQFRNLFPKYVDIAEDMDYLRQVRNSLQHEKIERLSQVSELIFNLDDNKIILNEEFVEDYRRKYIRVHNSLIEIKRDSKS